MLKREDIIRKCNQVDVDCIVGHGSALVMHGFKDETRDVDAGINRSTFEGLSGEVTIKGDYEMIVDYNNVKGVDMHPLDEEHEWTRIDGVRVSTLEQVIKDKLALGREKDFKQIEMIKKATR